MISTHILDTSVGTPAADVVVTLEKQHNGNWIIVDQGKTNSDGRYAFNDQSEVGVYRISFGVEAYYQQKKIECFFMDTVVVFQVKSTERKYHVPLLLNPYGYSTYRGS